MESLYSELVSSGIVKKNPPSKIQDYIGMFNFLGATFERAGSIPDPSMAQIRQLLTEYCILPLGSPTLHAKSTAHDPCQLKFCRLPHLKSLLLYGPAATGKSLLTQAIAHEAGANVFDLSPRNTDGKYQGKQVSLLIHMVFYRSTATDKGIGFQSG